MTKIIWQIKRGYNYLMSYFVYILRTSANTLYIGQTHNLKKRLREHRSKSPRSAKYIRYFSSFELVHQENFPTRQAAMQREYQLKQWSRFKKEALVAGDKILPKMKIYSYHPGKHRQEVLAIFKSRPDIFTESEIKQIEEETKLFSDEAHYKIVACGDKKVAGYGGAVFDPQQKLWNLDWLSVGEKFQRQGVGSLLMNLIIEWLQQQKADRLQVETCSCDGEAPARAFYTSHGFVIIKTEKDGYAKGHSKITFLKQL